MLDHESIGTKLPNGATIIALSARKAHVWIVLALIDGEYATWECDRPGDGSDTRWGHYHGDSFIAAVQDWKERGDLVPASRPSWLYPTAAQVMGQEG